MRYNVRFVSTDNEEETDFEIDAFSPDEAVMEATELLYEELAMQKDCISQKDYTAYVEPVTCH